MKRVISLVLTVVIAVLLFGCSASDKDKPSGSDAQIDKDKPSSSDVQTDKEEADKAEVDQTSDKKCGDDAYWELNGGVLTISGSGNMYDYTVSLANTKAVTWTSDIPWFDNRTEITKAVIGDGITGVGSEAFRGCINMSGAEMPDSLQYIGEDAFAGCLKLETVVVPDSVTKIGKNAFDRTGIKSITLGAGIKECGEKICADCGNLEQVTFNEGITTIGAWAFDGCRSLKSISLPDSITEIGSDAFSGCGGIEQFTFGNGITEIPEFLITNIKIDRIEIPEGVTTIGTGAFGACDKLSSVTLPSTLQNISKNAFVGCNAIKEVYFNGSREQWNAVNKNSGNETLTKAKITYQ